jgi:hypothetical protein
MLAFAASFWKCRERLAAFATSFRNRFEWLISFLKRRWILLSCAVVLFAFSLFDWRHYHYRPASERFFWSQVVGVNDGNVGVSYLLLEDGLIAGGGFEFESFHSPKLGAKFPEWTTQSNLRIVFPLWLPVAVILGWIVFRELRWRERRARKAEGASTNQ